VKVTSIDIASLISESEALERLMRAWQKTAEEDEAEIEQVRRRYRVFYAQAMNILEGEARSEFRKAYDGSFGNTDIVDFLADPLAKNQIFVGDEFKNSDLRWAVAFTSHIAPKMATQRDLLEQARLAMTDPEQLLSAWAAIFRRLPEFVLTWNRAHDPAQTPPLRLKNERGLQDLVEAILRLHFSDVRREDHVPQSAGAASLVDFQIPEIGLFIEMKMTRPTLRDKAVGEELLADAGRYPAHPDCLAILAVVYDPEFVIKNPNGLEADLSGATASGVPFRCVIAR
jgi:hypothetical protein